VLKSKNGNVQSKNVRLRNKHSNEQSKNVSSENDWRLF
jgi:hypothetical protein